MRLTLTILFSLLLLTLESRTQSISGFIDGNVSSHQGIRRYDYSGYSNNIKSFFGLGVSAEGQWRSKKGYERQVQLYAAQLSNNFETFINFKNGPTYFEGKVSRIDFGLKYIPINIEVLRLFYMRLGFSFNSSSSTLILGQRYGYTTSHGHYNHEVKEPYRPEHALNFGFWAIIDHELPIGNNFKVVPRISSSLLFLSPYGKINDAGRPFPIFFSLGLRKHLERRNKISKE